MRDRGGQWLTHFSLYPVDAVPSRAALQAGKAHCVVENLMKEFEVTCVTKPHRESRHEHITHIGNSKNEWRLTREEAIRRIDSRQESYYTIERQSGKRVYVGVVREKGKLPFLRTYADGKWNDNLLAQGECDGTCKLVA